MIAAGELPADVPADFGDVIDTAQKEAQGRLAKLVPEVKHVTKRTTVTRYTRSSLNSSSMPSAKSSRRSVVAGLSWRIDVVDDKMSNAARPSTSACGKKLES